jgi:hypothetical protein
MDNETFVPLPGEEYEADIVYPKEHNDSGFCWDETCPDREDHDNVQALGQAVTDGLVTPQEANDIYHGHTI